MDIKKIVELLPHRYPFLLVDRVLEIQEGKIKALKNVTFNEPFFPGHFPSDPVMPGVLVVEAMAQAGGVMLLEQVPQARGKLVLFTGIDKCRFRRPVVPGDQLQLEVELVAVKGSFAKLKGRASVDGKLVCQAELSCAVVDR